MNFYKRAYKAIEKIPSGNVTTYGYIATMLGKPRAARIVGWALRNLPADTAVPWWRVINAQGYLSIQNPHFPKDVQKMLLEKEGILVRKKYIVDLERYMWRP